MKQKTEKEIAYDIAVQNKDYEEMVRLVDEMVVEDIEKSCTVRACRNCIHMIDDEERKMYCSKRNPPKRVLSNWDYTDCDNEFEPASWYSGD